jgi:glycosyltransferase involved in cell wall biosynthesis
VSIVAALRQTRCDIVHVHSGVWFKTSVATRWAGVHSLVFTEHGREHDDPALARWLDRRAAKRTDAVVAVSKRLEGYLCEQVGIPRALLMTIENGVDTDRFSPAKAFQFRDRLGIPRTALVVGSVGRLEPVKGYERLLRAVAAVRARGEISEPIYVLLCGDGSSRLQLETLAGSLGLGDVVRFPGWVGDPVDAYRAMDLFVLPSFSEGLSVSLLEAMASGTPPLVTPVGANRDVLGDALASQVVSADDENEFASAMNRSLESVERRANLSAAARAAVVGRFSQRKMIDAYTDLYERLARRS